MDKNREQRQETAKETLKIIEQGWYETAKEKVFLPQESYETTYVLNENDFKIYEENLQKQKEIYKDNKPKYFIISGDSFDVARSIQNAKKTLVLNFASPTRAGGGFLTGASAQEECLCRNSTLYASLSSKTASKMYLYNQKNKNPLDSNYMLLTPNVAVFRNVKGEFLDKPFLTSVITAPAPNKNGRAKLIPQSQIDKVMRERIIFLLHTAAYNQYDTLILGAWGCGVFGHDPTRVARYFREALISLGNEVFFSNIVFAILEKSEQTKIHAFTSVFKDRI